jgi:hypothetical protein
VPLYWQGSDTWTHNRQDALVALSRPKADGAALYIAQRPMIYGLTGHQQPVCLTVQTVLVEKVPTDCQTLR